MTSSYQGRQSTNYLATDPDLSGAVNKEIDAGIKDTQAFYDQMVELEKLRIKNRDDNLASLEGLVKGVGNYKEEINDANEIRDKFQNTDDLWLTSKELLEEQLKNEGDLKKAHQKGLELAADAERDANDVSKSQKDREEAKDVARILTAGSFTYREDQADRANLSRANLELPQIFSLSSKDANFPGLEKTLQDAETFDEAYNMVNQYSIAYFQQIQRGRRSAGLRPLSLGAVRRHLSEGLIIERKKLIKEWTTTQDDLIKKEAESQDLIEVGTMFKNMETIGEEMTGENGWVTSKKAILEARGMSPGLASETAFKEYFDKVETVFADPQGGIDVEQLRDLMTNVKFKFADGSEGTLNSKNAPKGAKLGYQRLQGLVLASDADLTDELDDKKFKMLDWEDNEHKEHMSEDRTFEEDQRYILGFKQKFSITKNEELPNFIKDMQTSRELDDEAIVTEITIRRSKNLPVTESMIMKIQDPDTRDTQMQYVNTPELGAFTADEANQVDERIIAITKEAKDLKDLNQAKTDQYLVTRDNAKEFYTSRFKELVVGGQARATAFSTAKRETLDKMEKGDFDQETQLYINTQATLDLQATTNSIAKDPTLIYSTEEWAGEKPHLDIAREYIRTKGRSRYPSYYLRFNFIKNADGAYLTPEEIFETRVNKVSKDKPQKDGVLRPLPERTELKDNIGDQNKLLNKSNPTKTLEVISKPENQEWMTNTVPDTSAINADSIIRKLRSNIQRQQVIGGVDVSYKQQTTISDEDNAQLLEAVPELKDTPFLHFNNLSPAAAKALLQMTPIK